MGIQTNHKTKDFFWLSPRLLKNVKNSYAQPQGELRYILLVFIVLYMFE